MITFVKAPVVHLIADMQSVSSPGLKKSMEKRGSDFTGIPYNNGEHFYNLIPHGNNYTHAESLAVFSGKNCYNSFGKNGSTSTHEEYLGKNVYGTKPYGHYSITYCSHSTLYISGISRRIGEELKRHVTGTSVSQLSSRYCIHPPRFVVPPRFLKTPEYLGFGLQDMDYAHYKSACKSAYRKYLAACEPAKDLKGIEKKRILEAAAGLLPMSVETTIIFTMNPIAARKFIIERTGDTADLEIKRLAEKMESVLTKRYKAFKFR